MLPCLCSQDKLIDPTKEFYIGLVNPNAKFFLGQESVSDPDGTIDFHNTVHFHPNSIGIQENVVALYKQIIKAMIRSIPNPPMDREDVARFRRNLEKHLRKDFSAEERHRIEERKARTEANVKRIIRNCGGKNPLLGY